MKPEYVTPRHTSLHKPEPQPARPLPPYMPGGKPLKRMTFTIFPPRDHGRRAPKPVVIRLFAGNGRAFSEAQEIAELSKITDAIEQQYPSHEWRMTRVRRDEWNFTPGDLKPVRPVPGPPMHYSGAPFQRAGAAE